MKKSCNYGKRQEINDRETYFNNNFHNITKMLINIIGDILQILQIMLLIADIM